MSDIFFVDSSDMRHASRMILAPDRQTMQAVLHWDISFHGVELGHTAHIVGNLMVNGSADPGLRHTKARNVRPHRMNGSPCRGDLLAIALASGRQVGVI